MSIVSNGLSVLPLTEDNILSFSLYLPEEVLAQVGEDGCYGFGLLEGKLVSGAVFICENREEKIAEIIQLFVDESVRRRNGGTQLYLEVLKTAIANGMSAVAASYAYPEDEEVQSFLLKHHFQIFDSKSEGYRYGLYSIISRDEDYFKTEEDTVFQGNGKTLMELPILHTIDDYLGKREFESSYQYSIDGDGLAMLSVACDELPDEIKIWVETVSQEESEYTLVFSYITDIKDNDSLDERISLWQEAHDGINLLKNNPDEKAPDNRLSDDRLEFMMGLSFAGGVIEEAEFFLYFAQLVGEVGTFFKDKE